MSSDTPDRREKGPEQSVAGRRARAARDKRLAAALRENLKRRKMQERARATEQGDPDIPLQGPKGAEKSGGRPRAET